MKIGLKIGLRNWKNTYKLCSIIPIPRASYAQSIREKRKQKSPPKKANFPPFPIIWICFIFSSLGGRLRIRNISRGEPAIPFANYDAWYCFGTNTGRRRKRKASSALFALSGSYLLPSSCLSGSWAGNRWPAQEQVGRHALLSHRYIGRRYACGYFFFFNVFMPEKWIWYDTW